MSEHFAYGGHSRIHLHITNWICAEGKKTCKELVLRLQLKAILVQYLLLYKLSFNYDWLTEWLTKKVTKAKIHTPSSRKKSLKNLKIMSDLLLFFALSQFKDALYHKM